MYVTLVNVVQHYVLLENIGNAEVCQTVRKRKGTCFSQQSVLAVALEEADEEKREQKTENYHN